MEQNKFTSKLSAKISDDFFTSNSDQHFFNKYFLE